MIDVLVLARWMHVIGACVLLGTGAGIAFFMLIAHRTGEPRIVAHVAGTVVLADFLFTASAVVVQPLTGLWLAGLVGWPIGTRWIAWSLGLYGMVGLFWLPVVWLQLRMRDLARAAADAGVSLPLRYHRYFRMWLACGFPAFAGVVTIVWLMLARPV